MEERLVVGSCFEVGGLASLLSNILIKHGRLSRKGDLFRHHHCAGNPLPSFTRELYSLLQFSDQLG